MVEVPTYCRICEALCGLVATVEDGKLVSLRGDKEDPHSKGFCCAKGIAMTQIVNDGDRITQPMKRVGGPGEFAPCTWDEALGDIASRLSRLRKDVGPSSIAVHEGNPPYFGLGGLFWGKGFQATLGTPWFYGINSEDAASRVAATKILYGACGALPIPDVRRTSCMVIIGANPYVSKGSLISDPRLREHLDQIIDRGGSVHVVDPRRSETAKKFDHIAIKPATDAWFLLSLIEAIIVGGFVDEKFVSTYVSDWTALRDFALANPAEKTAGRTGIDAAIVRQLANTIGTADSAVVYGRTGTCTQAFGTLNNVLQDTVNIITGNFQREGGWIWGYGPTLMAEMAEVTKMASYDSVRSRVNGLPDSYGFLPSSALADEIRTPGEGQIKALAMIGSNPVVCGPAGDNLEGALESLDTFFAVDLYINETNRYAHYVLPVTSMYEREDAPIHFWDRYTRTTLRVTERVIEPRGDCREEWEILDEIAQRMGLGGAYVSAPLRWLARAGLRVNPRQLGDLLIRTGRNGDWFGLRRSGWSWQKLLDKAPRGVVLHEYLPVGSPKKRIKHKDGKIRLNDERIVAELGRLASTVSDPAYPFRLISLRELRSHNSWMHNSSKLMPESRTHELRLSRHDAAEMGLIDGDMVTVASKVSSLDTPVVLTDDLIPGSVALPHGWGHKGGWTRANKAGGTVVNFLASSDVQDIELLSGSTVLNGIPVSVRPAAKVAP